MPSGNETTLADVVKLLEQPQEGHHIAQIIEDHWPAIKAAMLARDATWRPMEALPPDQTDRIIMGVHNGQEHVVGEGYFDDDRSLWVWSIDREAIPAPTHWMPLPELKA